MIFEWVKIIHLSWQILGENSIWHSDKILIWVKWCIQSWKDWKYSHSHRMRNSWQILQQKFDDCLTPFWKPSLGIRQSKKVLSVFWKNVIMKHFFTKLGLNTSALSFYGSEMVLDSPNHFGWAPIISEGSNLVWLYPSHFGQVQIKNISPEKSNLNLTKTIWTVQNNFGLTEGQGIRAFYFCIFCQIIYCGPNQDRHILCYVIRTAFTLLTWCALFPVCQTADCPFSSDSVNYFHARLEE